jgi:predicted aspartyl protease
MMVPSTAREPMARRHVLSGGAAACAFAPWLVRAQPPPAPTPSVPTPSEKISAASDADHRLTVGVLLNGRGPYRFVVDTGADRSVIATDVAAALGLLRGKIVMVQGVVRTLASQTVKLRSLQTGPITREDLAIPVLPRALLGIDGYLGLDVIDGCRVTFDFKDHTLEIGERSGRFLFYNAPPNEERIPVYGDHGHLRSVDCRAGGVAATAFVDSGASVSVGNEKLFEALYARDPRYNKIGAISLTGVTGGEVIGGVTLVDKIRLKTLDFSDCPLVIADLQIFGLWGLTQRPALLIGMNYLRQFAKVSIDYGNKELRFKLAARTMTLAARG